jgi:hypothetical protein
MKLRKLFGSAGVAAVMALAFTASPASAGNTQLCSVHVSPCPAGSALPSLHVTNLVGSGGQLLNELVDILCLTILGQFIPLALASPQVLHAISWTLTNCGTSASHNECTITTEVQPLYTFLRLGLNVGRMIATSGIKRVRCTVFGFIKIDCQYSEAGTEFSAAGGNPLVLTATEAPMSFIAGSALCPTEMLLDRHVVALSPAYIVE